MIKRKELVDLKLYQHAETEKAYKVSVMGESEDGAWLPKSQVERGPREADGRYEFTMPVWLAEDKELSEA